QGRVDQLEAQMEAATLGQNPSLEAQFRELARLKGQKVEA
ncbi:phage-shock protein, partial [Aeromonas salmonicida subsp. salmonicida]